MNIFIFLTTKKCEQYYRSRRQRTWKSFSAYFFEKNVERGKKHDVSVLFTIFRLSHTDNYWNGTTDSLRNSIKPCICFSLRRLACVTLCHSVSQTGFGTSLLISSLRSWRLCGRPAFFKQSRKVRKGLARMNTKTLGHRLICPVS